MDDSRIGLGVSSASAPELLRAWDADGVVSARFPSLGASVERAAMKRFGSDRLAARTGAGLGAGRFWLQQRLWIAAAALLLLGGSGAAVVAASVASGHDASQANEAFRSSSAQVASSLTLAIQHEQDLMTSTSAFVAGNSTASNTRFRGWATAERALQRYPEVLGLGYAVVVPQSKLAAFTAASRRDPAGALSANGAFSVVPAGQRSFYCFTGGAVNPGGTSTVPAGFDYCDGPLARPILAARDSGASAYLPIRVGAVTGMTVFTPVYRGEIVPATTAARRQAFVAWVGVTVVPGFLLAEALASEYQRVLPLRRGCVGRRIPLRRRSAWRPVDDDRPA